MSLENSIRISRRSFLRQTAVAGAATWGSQLAWAADKPVSPFAQRGYYITFMRMPTYGLAQWKEIIDCIRADGGNLLLLWMAGAFRSKHFPVTWKYNEEHANVRRDFGRDLIRYAHRKGVKVLLGFTPFGYDGVNQYPAEHPEIKAMQKDGKPSEKWGIHSWGWNLCPSRPEAQRFMLDYVREMYFEFYPEADGLFIESSDYAICHCQDCRGRFFDREFEFVETISREAWARKPGAMVVVYPHYFSGSKVPGFDVQAATKPFDPRWSLCFTPHSAHPDPKLIRQARASIWSDDSTALRDPLTIRKGAQRARDAGMTGCVPSLEAFTFVATDPEEGQQYLIGRRQIPWGFGWLKPDEMPYAELPLRVNRIAYREFSANPDLPFEEFKQRLGREIFRAASSTQLVDDLLRLQHCFLRELTWRQSSPLVSPDRVRAMRARGQLTAADAASYRTTLEQLREIAARHRNAKNAGAKDLHRITQWVLNLWVGSNADLLKPN